MVRIPETLIGEPANLGDLIVAHAVFLHPAAGRIGTVGSKVPNSNNPRAPSMALNPCGLPS